jgi:Ca-activated chloride channel family protein
MEGAKWEAADWAVRKFLSGLSPLDSFNVCLFHSSTCWFEKKPVKADEANVEKAVQFLLSHKDSGGTELGVTLEETLTMPRAAGAGSRQVLIITDAEVSDASRILRLADEEFSRNDRRRISLLCVDASPNSFLAGTLAERGGGVARFLTSDPNEEDISTALDEVLEDWRQPVLTGLRLKVEGSDVQAVGRKIVSVEPGTGGAIDLGDLPAGRSVWVAGKAKRGASGALQFRLGDSARAEIAAAKVEVQTQASGLSAIRALFGAKRMLDIEYLMHANYPGDELAVELKRLGYDSDKLLKKLGKSKVYAENIRKDVEQALKGLLVETSLGFGLVCSETAFIAVRKEAGKKIEGTVAVANALPAGWSEQFASGSAGGAPGGAMMFCSAMPPMAGPPPMPKSAGRGHGAMPPAAQDTNVGAVFCEAAPEPPAARPIVLFSGVPAFAKGECVLFDTARKDDARRIALVGRISALMLSFPGKPAGKIDGKLMLLVFVDDMAMPRAKIKLADVAAQGGKRPLNVSLKTGCAVRVVLLDPSGVWGAGAPKIEIGLVV